MTLDDPTKKKLYVLAGLVVALLITVYLVSPGSSQDVETDAMQPLKCAKCGGEIKMTFAAYHAKYPNGIDALPVDQRPKCAKCGEALTKVNPTVAPKPPIDFSKEKVLTVEEAKRETKQIREKAARPKAPPARTAN